MKWVLLIGVALSARTEMGTFETDRACLDAASAFIRLFAKHDAIAVCVDEKTATILRRNN